ncbi:ESCRT-II complex, vps25 subunit, partial [Kipferlia bialata]
LQRVAEMRQRQTHLWGELVLRWCRHHNVKLLTVSEAASSDLFTNKDINRSLPRDAIVHVLDSLELTGHAEWEGDNKERCTVMWRSVSAWGDKVMQWANRTGYMGSIVTVSMIVDDEDDAKSELYGLESEILSKVLLHLFKQGRCDLVGYAPGQRVTGDTGVKFLTA